MRGYLWLTFLPLVLTLSCLRLVDRGDPCEENRECEEDEWCKKGSCTSRETDPMPCDDDFGCYPYQCSAGFCQYSCYSKDDCVFDDRMRCVSNKCVQ
jgi:hypothetical protein